MEEEIVEMVDCNGWSFWASVQTLICMDMFFMYNVHVLSNSS